jgi:hypothetical protein
MVVLKRLDNPGEMRQSPKKHENMENLMRASNDITRPRPCFLRVLVRVHHGARYVEHCFQNEPSPAHLTMGLRDTELSGGICHGEKSRKAQRDEHNGAEVSPFRCAKLWDEKECSACGGESADLAQVCELDMLLTVCMMNLPLSHRIERRPFGSRIHSRRQEPSFQQ